MSKFTVLDLIQLKPERPNAMDLRCLCGSRGLPNQIYSTEINRPGMAFTGFFEKFVGERVQIIGRGEFAYIQSTPEHTLRPMLKRLFSFSIPCFIFCSSLEPPAYFRDDTDAAGIPVLLTPLDSSSLSIRLLRALDDVFAPNQTIHAAFMEVEGMGVLIKGESGVGKSETAMALLDRGHRLIADDSVLIKCLNGDILWGSGAGELPGHHMEIRGLGIIDIARMYGMNAVQKRKQVEMVVQLEEWDSAAAYDRLGTAEQTITLLGVSLPLIVLPIKPGRNIPIIIEAAVLNQRLKFQGFNAAREFSANLKHWIASRSTESRDNPEAS